MYGVKRIVEENGFFEDRNTIKRNLRVSFLATENYVTLESACKHLSLLETVATSTKLQQELIVIDGLLHGKFNVIRDLVVGNRPSAELEKLVSAVTKFEEVINFAEIVDQNVVVNQAFALAKHIIAEVHGTESYCDHIKTVMEEQIRLGIYEMEWLKCKVSSVTL